MQILMFRTSYVQNIYGGDLDESLTFYGMKITPPWAKRQPFPCRKMAYFEEIGFPGRGPDL